MVEFIAIGYSRYEIKNNECGMSLRFRRKRIVVIFVVSFIVLGLFRDYLPTGTTEQVDDEQHEQVKKRVKQSVDEIPSSTSTTSSSSRSLRTEIIEINGTTLRKIDWHDYAAIAREKARTGEHFVLCSCA